MIGLALPKIIERLRPKKIPFAQAKVVIDPEGRRLLGFSRTSGKPVFALKGHGLTLSANGGGKTTRVAMPGLLSLAASEPEKAILVLDSKDGEIAAQAAPMLAKMGRKVVVIDDLNTRPELAAYRASLNPFGSVVSTYQSEPLDLTFATETITQALIPEPSNDDKNRYFRAWPRNFIEFGTRLLLKRSSALTTPGGVAALLGNSQMLQDFAGIEAEEALENDPALATAAMGVRDMAGREHYFQHLEEAQRSLKIYAPGTRLHDAGKNASQSHADLIRDGAVILLVGPQRRIERLGSYYALHILAFCDALFDGAGPLRILADEFTNAPLKSLVASLTTLRGFGGEVHMIAQSRSEIIRKFGQHETQTIEDNAITKQWLGFSNFKDAEEVSKSMGEQHMIGATLGGDSEALRFQQTHSLAKQPIMTPAELMAMPPSMQLVHIKGVGYILLDTLSQAQIAPYCHLLLDNPIEGGRLTPDPLVTLTKPETRS